MTLALPSTAAWWDWIVLTLFAGCACAGLAVLLRTMWSADDDIPISSPAPVAEEWLRDSLRGAGYELLTVSRGHRLPAGTLGEFGFTSSDAGWVRRLRVRTWDGSVREGWLSVCGESTLESTGPAGRWMGVASVRQQGHLEITWDY